PDSEIKPTMCQLPLVPRYNTSKIIVAGTGSQRSTINELNSLIGIALDSMSNLYVLDAGNSRVLKYHADSKQEEAVIGQGMDRYPKASSLKRIFIDKNDLLYTYQENKDHYGVIVS
ncbi:unnamed protein product, partial [Rotaria sp. Silwood2]